jgi:hypothetical protein
LPAVGVLVLLLVAASYAAVPFASEDSSQLMSRLANYLQLSTWEHPKFARTSVSLTSHLLLLLVKLRLIRIQMLQSMHARPTRSHTSRRHNSKHSSSLVYLRSART